MARPSKYNWEAIKEAFEGGIDLKDIALKFKVERKKINEKAKLKKWVVKDHLKHGINEFKESCERVPSEQGVS